MDRKSIEEYYSREDIRQAILNMSKGREVVGSFPDGRFSKRPNTLLYARDIEATVKSGCIEFHGSIERWSNPMSIKLGNYDSLRTGWDFILDIDCKVFEYAKIAAKVFIRALEDHDIKNISVKFSGGTGFHIGIPWESMPKEIDYRKTANSFPELPRGIAHYLKHYVKDVLAKEFLKVSKPEELAEKTGQSLKDIEDGGSINPFEIADIDPVLISPRHLYRLPFSINRKTFLISLPVEKTFLEDFDLTQARMENIKVKSNFLENHGQDEANFLFSEAMDFINRNKIKIEEQEPKKRAEIKQPIRKELFPPCIKNISNGLEDGKKRAVFILINFLSSVKWDWESIEEFILDWNRKNAPPLPESYVSNQIRWHKSRDNIILPPNCPSETSKGWYDDVGVCKPDKICGVPQIKIKNPVNYISKILNR